MRILQDLLAELPDGEVLDIRVGALWTAVVVEVERQKRCGLASTLQQPAQHGAAPPVPEAGRLTEFSGRALAERILTCRPPQSSIGMAALNALLPMQSDLWADANAEAVLAQIGAGKKVALVGHFPFIPRLREQVERLWVLELQPREDDLPAEAADRIIPEVDVVALTGTTLLNGTFESLMELRRSDAQVLVLGPSTPLSPVLFRHGVDWISGAIVENIDAVLQGVSQGASFRQIHHMGVRLVTMRNPLLDGSLSDAGGG